MKNLSKYIIPAMMLIMQACSQTQPNIKWLWEQTDGEKQFFVGQSIPLKADIYGGKGVDSLWLHLKPVSGGNWEYIYPVPSELFHNNNHFKFEKQVSIPGTAHIGKYEVGLFAILKDGSEINNITDIRLSVDGSFPWIADLEIGLNGRQDDLHLAADISAAKQVEKITVVIQGKTWKNSYEFTEKSIRHKVEAHFHEHINLKSALPGTYKVKVILEDRDGRVAKQEGSFTKEK